VSGEWALCVSLYDNGTPGRSVKRGSGWQWAKLVAEAGCLGDDLAVAAALVAFVLHWPLVGGADNVITLNAFAVLWYPETVRLGLAAGLLRGGR
jgi:hypothetical protein